MPDHDTDPYPEVNPFKPHWAKAVEPEPRDVIQDHYDNPEYEVHVGREVILDGRHCRLVSIWLSGEKWTGFLFPAGGIIPSAASSVIDFPSLAA